MGLELIKDTAHKNLIYIAGPMRGYVNLNRDEFYTAERKLEVSGIYSVINPARLDDEEGLSMEDMYDKVFLRDAMKRDINAIFECDSIYMLNGWEGSEVLV